MARTPNIHGGGAQTNTNGLQFERDTDLPIAIKKLNQFSISHENKIIKNNIEIGQYFEKHKLYSQLLTPQGVNYKDVISKKLLPDGAILIYETQTPYIIEKKYQNGAGSVDEKLQTCDFKKKQYKKLFKSLFPKLCICNFGLKIIF